MTFESLRFAAPILRAIGDEGYTSPTPIQAQAIPHVLAGGDLLGCAQTGTGKTAAFAMPILHNLSSATFRKTDPKSSRLRCLVLCPTRELAAQITESFNTYGKYLKLRHTAVFGGVGQFPQVRAIKRGVDILIATPGRLLDLMGQGHIDLRSIQTLVLDEADQMLDMGFLPDIRRIVQKLPEKRQTLMFSATMPREIRALADTLLRDPISVEVTPVASTVETITQRVYRVPNKSKQELLTHLLLNHAMQRTLVFTRTKHGADRVVKHLERAGVRAEAIHGNKSQNARTRALESFKGNKPPVLVATDIASRGIDVDNVTHVINFDMPTLPEAYVHRIGRTARAGASGVAVSFCCPEEHKHLRAIERLTRRELDLATDMPALTIVADDSPRNARSQRNPGDFAPRRKPANAARRNGAGRPGKPKANRNGSPRQATHTTGSERPHAPGKPTHRGGKPSSKPGGLQNGRKRNSQQAARRRCVGSAQR